MIRNVLIGAALVLAGCSGAAMNNTGAPPTSSQGAASALRTTAGPDACDHVLRVVIKKSGGAFNVPTCKGWSGVIDYPPPSRDLPQVRLKVTSSVTSNFGAPPPPEGTALFYLRTQDWSRRTLPVFQNTGVMDTISSPQLTPSNTYTLYVYNLVENSQCGSPPCPPWVLDLGSPMRGTNSITFFSPLNGAVFGGEGYQPPVWQFVQN